MNQNQMICQRCKKSNYGEREYQKCNQCGKFVCQWCFDKIDSGVVDEKEWTLTQKVKCECSNMIIYVTRYDGDWRK